MEALANVSRVLSEHRMLDLCVAPVRLSSVASLKLFFFERADAVYLKEMLFKSVNASYEHGTMEKHCLLAC